MESEIRPQSYATVDQYRLEVGCRHGLGFDPQGALYQLLDRAHEWDRGAFRLIPGTGPGGMALPGGYLCAIARRCGVLAPARPTTMPDDYVVLITVPSLDQGGKLDAATALEASGLVSRDDAIRLLSVLVRDAEAASRPLTWDDFRQLGFRPYNSGNGEQPVKSARAGARKARAAGRRL